MSIDPSSLRFARFTARPDTSTAEAPRIEWRSGESGGERGGERSPEIGSATGVWLAGESGAVAVFDLSRSMDWWKCRTVRRVSTGGELVSGVSAELLRALPLDLEGENPRVSGSDWTFRPAPGSIPDLARGTPRFVLTLLDVESLEWTEIVCDRSGAEIVARRAATFESARRRPAGALAWNLECRAGDTAVARSSGRR